MFCTNSIFQGFLISNAVGKGIVIGQLLFSVFMFAVLFGKYFEFKQIGSATRRFLNDFNGSGFTLEIYLRRGPVFKRGVEQIYRSSLERLTALFGPEICTAIRLHQALPDGATDLNPYSFELVASTCESTLLNEVKNLRYGMGFVVLAVSVTPMLGLLGTVWGVLDAFAEMGSAGSANLATIAPAISSALVTTVAGLLVAIPGSVIFSFLDSSRESLQREMEDFSDELLNRLACEYKKDRLSC